MSPNLLGIFGALTKEGADAPTARAARIAGLLQEGYVHWLNGVAANVESSTRFVSGLSGVSNAADLAALNCDWMNRTQALAVEQWETFMELSSQLTVELGLPRPPVSSMLPFAMTPPLEDALAAKEMPTMAVPAAVPIPVPPSEEASVASFKVEGLSKEAEAPSGDVKASSVEVPASEPAPAEPTKPAEAATPTEPVVARPVAAEPPPAPAKTLEEVAKPAAPKLSSTLKAGASKTSPRTAAPRRKPSSPKGQTPVQ